MRMKTIPVMAEMIILMTVAMTTPAATITPMATAAQVGEATTQAAVILVAAVEAVTITPAAAVEVVMIKVGVTKAAEMMINPLRTQP